MSKIARTTNALTASSVIKGTRTGGVPIGLVALARHNFSVVAQIRLRLYSDTAWTTQVYDSGTVDVWPPVYTYPEALTWESSGWWDGKYSAAEIVGGVWSWIKYTGQNYLTQSFQIDITDTGNASGALKVGFLELASAWQVEYDYENDASYAWAGRSTMVEAWGGGRYYDQRAKGRTFSCNFVTSIDEGLQRHLERFRQLDVNTPFLFIPDPNTPANFVRTAMLCQHVELSPWIHSFVGAGRVAFNVQEVIG